MEDIHLRNWIEETRRRRIRRHFAALDRIPIDQITHPDVIRMIQETLVSLAEDSSPVTSESPADGSACPPVGG